MSELALHKDKVRRYIRENHALPYSEIPLKADAVHPQSLHAERRLQLNASQRKCEVLSITGVSQGLPRIAIIERDSFIFFGARRGT
jgi:hypothetical protein